MPTEKKAQLIEELQYLFSKSKVGVLTDYRGLPTSAMVDVRRKLSEAKVEYKVVKNTLARFAAEKAGRPEVGKLFEGPVAVAFGFESETQPAKIVIDFIRTSKSTMTIKGGFLNDRPLTPEQVTALATMPPRETLYARVVGGIQGPLVALVSTLNGPVVAFMGVLQARMKQMEEK